MMHSIDRLHERKPGLCLHLWTPMQLNWPGLLCVHMLACGVSVLVCLGLMRILCYLHGVRSARRRDMASATSRRRTISARAGSKQNVGLWNVRTAHAGWSVHMFAVANLLSTLYCLT
jgi:hypothetical protein